MANPITANDFTRLLSYSERMINEKAVDRLRPYSEELAKQIEKHKIITAIKGLRGVGKSSLLLHLLKEHEASIYINAEYLVRQGYSLYEVLDYVYEQGYSYIGIDEIHAINDWTKELKLFYDQTRAKIIITGSSALSLAVQSSELSRRITIKELKPFSFREYLFFKKNVLLEKRELEEIINNRQELVKEIAPYISYYEEFVRYYGLPAAFFEGKEVYAGIIERIIYYDLLAMKSIDVGYMHSAFKVLKFLCSSKPGELSYNAIANSIGRSVKFTISLIRLLADAGIIRLIDGYGKGHKAIRSEQKITMPLSFRNGLAEYFNIVAEKGALREDFFVHHLEKVKYVKDRGKKVPDYYVDGKVFEIGGKAKGKKQLKGFKEGYLVKEDLSIKENIPIYLFGLLY